MSSSSETNRPTDGWKHDLLGGGRKWLPRIRAAQFHLCPLLLPETERQGWAGLMFDIFTVKGHLVNVSSWPRTSAFVLRCSNDKGNQCWGLAAVKILVIETKLYPDASTRWRSGSSFLFIPGIHIWSKHVWLNNSSVKTYQFEACSRLTHACCTD